MKIETVLSVYEELSASHVERARHESGGCEICDLFHRLEANDKIVQTVNGAALYVSQTGILAEAFLQFLTIGLIIGKRVAEVETLEDLLK